jgi:hypothetical protein
VPSPAVYREEEIGWGNQLFGGCRVWQVSIDKNNGAFFHKRYLNSECWFWKEVFGGKKNILAVGRMFLYMQNPSAGMIRIR